MNFFSTECFQVAEIIVGPNGSNMDRLHMEVCISGISFLYLKNYSYIVTCG